MTGIERQELLCWGKKETIILTVSTSEYLFFLLCTQTHTYVMYKTYREMSMSKRGKDPKLEKLDPEAEWGDWTNSVLQKQ